MPINELKLAKELIRRPSITPKEAGAINILAKKLRSLLAEMAIGKFIP